MSNMSFCVTLSKAMRRTALILVVPIAGALAIGSVPVSGQEWDRTLRDGTVILEEDLSKIVQEHEKWLTSNGKEGRRADLSRARLDSIYLNHANLRAAALYDSDLSDGSFVGSNLSQANLRGSILSGANLSNANLSHADLRSANLTHVHALRADMRRADLRKANLRGALLARVDLRQARLNEAVLNATMFVGANLSGADLTDADMTGANLTNSAYPYWMDNKSFTGPPANLSGARLVRANLLGADLTGANLNKADLSNAELRNANLTDVNLGEANLTRANLSGAILEGANLSGAHLDNANLRLTNLTGANLSETHLRMTDLEEADLSKTNLEKAFFEPRPGTLPGIQTIATAKNIQSIKFDSPHALAELREAFKSAGFRQREREMTYLIERFGRQKAGIVEGALRYVFLELTCDYGMSAGRSLLIALLLIPIFAIPYTAAINPRKQHGNIFVATPHKRDGIWRVWGESRIRMDLGGENPELVNAGLPRALLIGLYFSMLSAFHIGWRDLNVGSWIARLQFREYTFRATGWVRTVSTAQSLISVYLLALWVVTYFGRPFE